MPHKLSKRELLDRLAEFTLRTQPGYRGHAEDARVYWRNQRPTVADLALAAQQHGLLSPDEAAALTARRCPSCGHKDKHDARAGCLHIDRRKGFCSCRNR